MLCMIFYWQKFFYIKNIQRSFLVRCRLGKLAFFITATPITPIKINPKITAHENHCHHCVLAVYILLKWSVISQQFIAQTPHAICPSLLLKLSVSTVELVAHSGVNILAFAYIIVDKLLSVKCSKLIRTVCYKMLLKVQNLVSYVIIKCERLRDP